MLDGPVVAGVVFAGGAVLVGGYFYVEHLRHGRKAVRATRVAERLPLFGVDPGAADPTGTRVPTTSRMPRPEFAPRRPGPGDFAPPPPRAAAATPAAERGYSAIPGTPAYGIPANGGPGYSAPGYAMSSYAANAGPAAERLNGDVRQPSAFPTPRYADGQTLRFALPDEGTLQFLPGRLQVIAGPENGREIRFVRSPGSGETDVSFGRSEGPAHRHVQLLVPTVSRRHALMSLIDEHWSLQNLSATNPVTHNGRRLAPDEVVPLLIDGDRIEMGEVVFAFHSR